MGGDQVTMKVPNTKVSPGPPCHTSGLCLDRVTVTVKSHSLSHKSP